MASKHNYLSTFTRQLRCERKHQLKGYSKPVYTRTFQMCVTLHTAAYLKAYLLVTTFWPKEFLLQSVLDLSSVPNIYINLQ
jgi:hypothetical protein